jgi:polyphosphate kinase 2 (PPK2 family)
MGKNKDQGTNEPSLKRKKYDKELRRLQAELCKLQDWIKFKGLRVIIVFEGRDAARKGGTIRAITERVSPGVFHLVALPVPIRSREKSNVFPALHAIFPRSGRGSHL